MFSSKSSKNADACRFCWMCRHICPVAGSTGNEAWTPRARGLLVSMINRGTEFDMSIAETMYKCSLCEACSNDCVTGFMPPDYIREARSIAISEGIAPKAVINSIDNINEKNNIYGENSDDEVVKLAKEHCEKTDVLLYLGQLGWNRSKNTSIALASILKKANIAFTIINNEPVSGAFLRELLGDVAEVQQKAKLCSEAIEKTGATKLIVLDPHDAVIFRDQYSDWGLLKGIEVISAIKYVKELIENGALTIRKTNFKASFHDPCRLTRGLGEADSARYIMDTLGIELKELFLNKKMSRCCGGVVLDSHSPEVVKAMVATRSDDAVRIGSDTIITACPDCTSLFNKYAVADIKYVDLYQLLDENC